MNALRCFAALAVLGQVTPAAAGRALLWESPAPPPPVYGDSIFAPPPPGAIQLRVANCSVHMLLVAFSMFSQQMIAYRLLM